MARPKTQDQTNNEQTTNEELNQLETIEVIDKSFDSFDEPDELESLMQTAENLNLKVSGNDTVDSLREKVTNKLNSNLNNKEVTVENKNTLLKKATLLKRVKIDNLDPIDRNKKGEFIHFYNSNTGHISYFVPYGKHCGEHGTHLPMCILNILENKKYQIFVDHVDDKGNKTKKSELSKKFIISYLPNITNDELKELKRRQMIKIT